MEKFTYKMASLSPRVVPLLAYLMLPFVGLSQTSFTLMAISSSTSLGTSESDSSTSELIN